MKKLRLLPLLLCLSLAAGCTASSRIQPITVPEGSPSPVEETSSLLSEGAGGYRAFGLELLRTCREEGKNTLVSPLSVTLALGMTANGASGDTLSEFEALLGQDRDTLNSLCAAFLSSYAALGGSSQATLVNSLWADPDLTLKDDFILRCADTYQAQLYHADLQDSKTASAVNAWVSEATHGLIPSVIDQFDSDAALALINAVYLKNQFAQPFPEPHSQWTMPFTAEDGTSSQVPGMNNGTRQEEYIPSDGGPGVLLPYDDGQLGLLLILPNEGTSLTDCLASWDASTISALLEARTKTQVKLTMPKFQVDWSASLKEVLSDLGLSEAFTPSADFSAMGTTQAGPLYIGDVIHKTALQVNEKGTEAAAVTAVDMDTKSALPPDSLVILTLNRPFIYAIVDLNQNIPLFLGTIEKF